MMLKTTKTAADLGDIHPSPHGIATVPMADGRSVMDSLIYKTERNLIKASMKSDTHNSWNVLDR